MTTTSVYSGKDLEAMSFAVNYRRWIFEEFRPYVGKHLVEVGAGSGSFSQLLLASGPATLVLVEPSQLFTKLRQSVANTETTTKVRYYNALFGEVSGHLEDTPDTILYINVLEHIEDDLSELRQAYETLNSGGHLLVFVPALQVLYGDFDARIGHFRRYDRRGLEAKAVAVGFRVVRSSYFDFTGILPWFIKYKLLKSDALESRAVAAYDKLVVPAAMRLERLLSCPIGKNLLMVLQK